MTTLYRVPGGACAVHNEPARHGPVLVRADGDHLNLIGTANGRAISSVIVHRAKLEAALGLIGGGPVNEADRHGIEVLDASEIGR